MNLFEEKRKIMKRRYEGKNPYAFGEIEITDGKWVEIFEMDLNKWPIISASRTLKDGEIIDFHAKTPKPI